MKIFLTFNQNARLYSWLQQHSDLCRAVTGKNPAEFVAKPITDMDLRHLPTTHVEFPGDVQWWVNKHCPYNFAHAGEGKKHPILLIIKDWYYYKVKKGS